MADRSDRLALTATAVLLGVGFAMLWVVRPDPTRAEESTWTQAHLPVESTPKPVPIIVPIPRERIERDLALEVRISGKFEISLVNRSRDTTYHVVRFTGGCEYGSGEPRILYVAWSADGRGGWRPVPKRKLEGLCGNSFLYAWGGKTLELKPGDRQDILPEFGPFGMLDCPREGRIRLQVRYVYRASRPADRELSETDMKGVPPFELVSEPIEFELPIH